MGNTFQIFLAKFVMTANDFVRNPKILMSFFRVPHAASSYSRKWDFAFGSDGYCVC